MPRGYESTVPASMENPVGMQIVFGDRYDRYAVSYIRDIEYLKRGEQALHIQMIVPGCGLQANEAEYPLVVYVQGSGWQKQDCYRHIPQIAEIARKGYVVASVEHRESKVAGSPAFLQDVKAAIRFLRKNAKTYNIDSERVAIWGCSSGGHAACLVGVTDGVTVFDTEEYHEFSSSVSAVIDFYGVIDVSKLYDAPRHPDVMSGNPLETPEAILFGGRVEEKKELVQQVNPIAYVSKDKKIPPFLIMHGDEDEIIPFNQSVIMYEALRANGKRATLYKVQGGMHGTRFWMKDVLDVVTEFLSTYL